MDFAKKIISKIKFRLNFFYQNISIKSLKNISYKSIVLNFFKFIFSKRFVLSHYFMMCLVFLLTLTSIYLFYSRFRVAEASDAWFNSDWFKRQKIDITLNRIGTQTDFIAEASLPTQTLIGSGFMNPNCSDIRVTDKNLNLLDHWVDTESCNTSSTKIFFKIPVLSGTDIVSGGINTFYIYYFNPSATFSTVPQTSLFLATIPNLLLNYDFENIDKNVVTDRSGLGNNGKIINTALTYPDGNLIINNSTFPEGYKSNAFFFNGYNVFISTPVLMLNLTNAYSLISYIKPEGTRANGYIIQNESMGKMFNFENINKTGTTCNAAEYNESDGAAGCVANGVLFSPDSITPKKSGSYNYYYDFYFNKITRPSLSVTFDGTTDYLYQNNPVNFLPLLTNLRPSYGFKYKLKLYGSPGETRSIHSWGNTSPGNFSYSLDYNVCTDGSLRFILDYNNSRSNSLTLATPCLNNISPSSKVSTLAGNYSIQANSNKWFDLVTAQIENKRYISINGILVFSDATSNVTIARENVPLYLGKSSNSDKTFMKGEIEEYVSFGQDQDWFNNNFFTSGNFNTTLQQYSTNIARKSYVIFGNNHNNFFQAGFSNHANARYQTATAISNFNYNFNTNDNNDYYQQYGGNLDNTLNIKPAFISGTHNLFDGKWYLYYSQFDDNRNSIASRYINGNSTYSYENGYRDTNPNGVLTIGGYVNQNEDTGTFPSEFFYGGMDEVFVYAQTLSTTQLNYHSQPWNGYASYGKTLWQSPLLITDIGKISSNQSFLEETISVKDSYWFDRSYPFRSQINFYSLPQLTIPNFQVSFVMDTASLIKDKKLNPSCSGILITDSFLRRLPFWVEGCNSSSTIFYVKMNPSNSNSKYEVRGGANQSLYVYYGNVNSSAQTFPPSQVFDYTIPGLEIAYTFDDNTSVLAYDKSGNGLNMNFVNTSTTASGVFGNATVYNGSSSYGTRPVPDATIRSSWSGITTMMWIRPEGLNTSTLRSFLTHQYAAGDTRFLQFTGQGSGEFTVRFQFYAGAETYGLNFGPHSTDTYNYTGVAWEFGDGKFLSTFYNQKISSTANSTLFQSYPNTGDNLIIGSFCCNPGYSQYFSGPIDEFRLFSRRLSDTEIRAYTLNTTIGTSRLATSGNSCNQVNNYCMKSFVTPSFPDVDLLGKYNSNVYYSTSAEESINYPYYHLKFNESEGVYANDSAGRLGRSFLGPIRSTTIATGNEPLWSSEEKCIEGECLYFDGLNDYVDVATIPSSQGGASLDYESNYSYSFWLRPLSNPNSRYTVVSSRFGIDEYTIYLDNQMKLILEGSSANTIINSSASTLPINKWSHVTYSYEHSTKTNKFYINGELDSTSQNIAWSQSLNPYVTEIFVSSIPNISLPGLNITVNFDTASLISNNKLNPACTGMVIEDEFNRELPFWVEGCNTSTSKIHIRMNPDSSKGGANQRLFAYYGNNDLDKKVYKPNEVFDFTIPGLEVAYTFDDDSSTTSFDKSGNGVNLTKFAGTPTTPQGAYGSSLNLNGTSQYGSAPISSSDIRSNWSGITTLLWFKPQGTNQAASSRNLFAIQGESGNVVKNYTMSTSLGGNQLTTQSFIYSGTPILIQPAITSTNYVYHGVSWEFGSGKFIKSIRDNSILSLANGTSYLSFPATNNGLFVGGFCCSIANLYTGPIDEVRLFDRALSDTELRAYSLNSTLGSSTIDTVNNTCNQVNNYCMKSFVTPSYPGHDLLGKYNSNVRVTTMAETKIDTKVQIGGNTTRQSYASEYFRGYVDEFKFYKVSIGSEDVLNSYQKGLNNLKYNLSADSETIVNFNLMAYYSFDETDRQVAFDYSDIRAEASYPSSTNLNIAGVFNNAFSSPGVGTSNFQISNSDFINLTSQATYTIWARILDTSGNTKYLLDKSGTGGFEIKYNSGTQKYSANICGVELESANTFTTGVWDNIVLTSNSKKAKLFVNSVLQDEEFCFNNYVGSKSNTSSIRIGGDGSANGTINALIDDFRIYDNYLNNKQVQLLYSYKPYYPSYGAGPVSFYKLDASAGTTTAVDASGNNNTLTMINPATNQNSWSTFGKIGNSYDFVTRAAGALNLFSTSSSTLTTGLTRPHTIMGWVAFSHPFYGNYTMGFEPAAITIGNASSGDLYSFLTFRPNSLGLLDSGFFFWRDTSRMVNFSSPYLYLTYPTATPVWYHVAATYDGYLRSLYINGNLVNVDTGVNRTSSISTSQIAIGGATGNYSSTQFQYMGMLDEVKIYNYARTQEQIIMDMRNAGSAPALNSTLYSNLRSNQRTSTFNTLADGYVRPQVSLEFDSYFGPNEVFRFYSNILASQASQTLSSTATTEPIYGDVTLNTVTINNTPNGVSNFQVQINFPMSSYQVSRFSEASCNNIKVLNSSNQLIPFWGVPNSCANGNGSIFIKIPVASTSQTYTLKLDTSTLAGGAKPNYASAVGSIFDTVITGIVAAWNFDETNGSSTVDTIDMSGNGRHIDWLSNRNIQVGAFGNSPNLNGQMVGQIANWGKAGTGFTIMGWLNDQVFTANNRNTPGDQGFLLGFVAANNSSVFFQRWENGSTLNDSMRACVASGQSCAFTAVGDNTETNWLFRGFTMNWGNAGQGSSQWLQFLDQVSAGPELNYSSNQPAAFPPVAETAYFANTWVTSQTNAYGWLGTMDEIRVLHRKVTWTEFQSYISNSTGSATPQGVTGGTIDTGRDDAESPCNTVNGWCTRSFISPSLPSTDLLGKYSSRVTVSRTDVNDPLPYNTIITYFSVPSVSYFSVPLSIANNGAEFIRNGGARGGSAYFFTASSEKSINFSVPDFNFVTGTDAAISFYIKPTETSFTSIATATGLRITKLSGNQINFSGANFSLTSTRTLPTNSWSHVFFQKNAQTGIFELIVDKELQVASYSAVNNLNLSNLKFFVTEGNPYSLDEIKIYNNVLDQNQISNLYLGGFAIKLGREADNTCVNGSTAFCSAPTDEFLFNEASGLTAFNTIIDRNDVALGSGTLRDLGYTGKGLKFTYLNTQTFATDFINNSGQGSFSFRFKSDYQGNILLGKGFDLNLYPGTFIINGSSLNSIYTGSDWSEIYNYGAGDPWKHINVNYDTTVTPARYSFYLDGVFLTSGTYTKNNNLERWMFTSGNFDDLRFFSYQRNPSQVAEEYARGKPFTHIKFDECNGSKFYNSNANIYRPLQYRENGNRSDTSSQLRTGLNLTVATGELNFNNCFEGKYNASFRFNGNYYLQGNDYHSRVFNSEGNATITFWVNLNNSVSQNTNIIGTENGTDGHLIKLVNKNIQISANSNGTSNLKLSGTKELSNDGWNHVAVVFDSGANYKLYINGSLDSESSGNFTSILNYCTGTTTLTCQINPFVVGKNFVGNLDELKIYNFPLTEKQIRIDMNQDSGIRFD